MLIYLGGDCIFDNKKKQILKKGKFITLNLRKPKVEQNRTEATSRRIVDLCLIIALIAISIYSLSLFTVKEFHGDAIFVSSSAKKKLPIYSVETDKPKVAISFDAAWGNGGLLESI